MTTGTIIENLSSPLRRRFPTSVSAATRAVRVCSLPLRQPSPTRPLRIEQPSSHQIQIRQCRSHFQAVQVLIQAPIAHLLEAEYSLDHPDRVLHLGTHMRFAAVDRFDALVHSISPSIALVGEVTRSRGGFAHRRLVATVGLIAPNPSLLAMQQVRSARPSGTFAAEARIVWISFVLLATPICAFIPKYHCLPFAV
jgi:hypothetical protein